MLREPSEEKINALQGRKDRSLSRDDVPCRLCGFGIRKVSVRENEDNSYRKEDTDTCENNIGRLEMLEI
jgi:hypothetical protein